MVVSIQTQVRDLVALKDACAELGLELLEKVEARGYAQQRIAGQYVIRLKGPYDIAVDHSAENDGSYGLTADWWHGHVAREVGVGYGRLLQTYGVHRTIRAATQRGLRTTRKIEADGSILLTLEGGSL